MNFTTPYITPYIHGDPMARRRVVCQWDMQNWWSGHFWKRSASNFRFWIGCTDTRLVLVLQCVGVIFDSFTTFITFTTAVVSTIFVAAIFTIYDVTIIVAAIISLNLQRSLSESKGESKEEGDVNQTMYYRRTRAGFWWWTGSHWLQYSTVVYAWQYYLDEHK